MNNPVGRPSVIIDEAKVEQLAAMFLTTAEIAAVFECSSDTLERNYAAALTRGRGKGGASLKRRMYLKAEAGDTTMLIWLSKNYLGMSDKIDRSTQSTQRLINIEELEAMTPAQRRTRIWELAGKPGMVDDDHDEDDTNDRR